MKIIFTKNIFLKLILFFMVIVDILVALNVHLFYLREIFSLIFLLFIPGILILTSLNFFRNEVSVCCKAIFILGCSISYLIFSGLFINSVFRIMSLQKPLALPNLLIFFNISYLIFSIIIYKKNTFKDKIFVINKKYLSNYFPHVLISIIPLLAVVGANYLNNGGNDIFTMIMIFLIIILVFILTFFHKRLPGNIYPYALYVASVSILLMFSLRSHHIVNYDANKEYELFQVTKNNLLWNFSSYPNDYNSSLSISILPSIISLISHINDEYIFKLIYQIIFAFIPLSIFILIRKYANQVIAFLCGFFFAIQPNYILVLTGCIKQEIAMFFFTLCILLIFNDIIDNKLKKILFILFAFSLVVSHYATTYITNILFFASCALLILIKKILNLKTIKLSKFAKPIISNFNKTKPVNSIFILVVIFSLTFFWYNGITTTGRSLFYKMKEIYTTISTRYDNDIVSQQTSFLQQFNIFFITIDPQKLLNIYIKEINEKYKNYKSLNLYPKETYSGYQPKVIYPDNSVPKIPLNINVAKSIYFLNEIIKKILKIFMIFGVIYLIFVYKKKSNIDMFFRYLSFCFLVILSMWTIFPVLTFYFGTERLYQQALIFLSFSAVVGGLKILRFVNINTRIRIISSIFIMYFAFTSGFIPQIIGNSEASLQLNNKGYFYDWSYHHTSEVYSAQWLSKNYNNKYLVYADDIANLRLFCYANIDNGITDILPNVIDKDAYVYLDFTNTTKNLAYFMKREGGWIGYNLPLFFLNNNKNIIYNNKESIIYK